MGNIPADIVLPSNYIATCNTGRKRTLFHSKGLIQLVLSCNITPDFFMTKFQSHNLILAVSL